MLLTHLAASDAAAALLFFDQGGGSPWTERRSVSPQEQQRWGEGRPADQLQGKIRAA